MDQMELLCPSLELLSCSLQTTSPTSSSRTDNQTNQIVPFQELDDNTDLNSSTPLEILQYHEQQRQLAVCLQGSHVELTSSGANISTEEENIHFLGPAESIKSLFKLPYSASKVSLVVHKVGNTLVVDGDIDEQEMPLHLMGKETPSGYIADEGVVEQDCDVVEEEEAVILNIESEDGFVRSDSAYPLDDSDEAGGNLYSKFICKSIPTIMNEDRVANERELDKTNLSMELSRPVLNPTGGDNSALYEGQGSVKTDNNSSHSFPKNNYFSSNDKLPNFQRILKWKFRGDMKMVLGTDLLMFSNKEHPAVSLKLHDMDKDLSLCTCLDYYLDNVMANIPELALCMHSKGFVRGYKLVQTSDIPHLSKTGQPLFNVQDVNMNATMLLKFLQENCSRSNGTYWLHRPEGSQALRLYDITVLSEGQQKKWKYMMAMVCYRFASRASRLINCVSMESPDLKSKLQTRQQELLVTCFELLQEIKNMGGSKHDSIRASVTEQLADSYLNDYFQLQEERKPIKKKTKSKKKRKKARKSSSCSSKHSSNVSEESLIKAKAYFSNSVSILTEYLESCAEEKYENHEKEDLDYPQSNGEWDAEEINDLMSFIKIQLDRVNLKYSMTCIQLASTYLEKKTMNEQILDNISFSTILQLILKLIDDASLYFASILSPEIVNVKFFYIDTLKYFQDIVNSFDFREMSYAQKRSGGQQCYTIPDLRANILQLIGDTASCAVTELSVENSVVDNLIDVYRKVRGKVSMSGLVLDGNVPQTKSNDQIHCHMEEDFGVSINEKLLKLALLCYLHALYPSVPADLYFVLMKKLGNACNELGKYLMSVEKNFDNSLKWYKCGCIVFSLIGDQVNEALICANLSNFHKILAREVSQSSSNHSDIERLKLEECYYERAVKYCDKGLFLLKENKADIILYPQLEAELASTYLLWGVRLSYCGIVENELKISDFFNKALNMYIKLKNTKQIAACHYQIATFNAKIWRCQYRTLKSPKLEMARRHYEKALEYFGSVELGPCFVIIHAELADMYACSGLPDDIEHAILVLLNVYEAYRENSNDQNVHSLNDLADQLMSKLQELLLAMVKLCKDAVTLDKKQELYKKMYRITLYNEDKPFSKILATVRNLYAESN